MWIFAVALLHLLWPATPCNVAADLYEQLIPDHIDVSDCQFSVAVVFNLSALFTFESQLHQNVLSKIV